MANPIVPTEPTSIEKLAPGTRVRVTQQIPCGTRAIKTSAVGAIVKTEQSPTGSWFAHARNDKFWLDRMTIRTDDGEIVELILDGFSQIEVMPD
jgi:hypothetical protein